MQSLVLPPSSFVTPEFGHTRFNPGPERLSLNLPRTTNARRCTPRDLPLPRSMSSSVPADDQLETSGNARRPGHPDLPQPVTTVATTAVGTIASTGVSGPVLPPGSPDPATIHDSALQRIPTAVGEEALRQSFAISEPFPTSRIPHSLSGQISAQPSSTPFPQTTFGTSPGTTTRALPQKPTRRTKAHVASACVNCKKKHLGCDPARPCRRCVLSGKESTCIDVTHKKRGRPPLKAEEASLRTYAAQMDNRGAGGEQQGPSRRTHMHRATSSREIRPMTDLQMPSGQTGAMGLRGPTGHPQRWPAAVYPHAVDPSLTMQRNMGHRRFSSSGSVQSMVAASPPSYVPVPGGYNPVMGSGRMHTGIGRPLSSYGDQGLHPAASPPQYTQSYGVPISPYPDAARMMNRMQMAEASVQRDPRDAYVASPVRLPPIYAPTLVNQQGHRLSDSYPAMWSPQTREEYLQQQQQPQQPQPQPQQQQTEPRQPVQPQALMEPISPSSQLRQAASDLGFGDAMPRQFGAISPHQAHQLTSTRAQDEQQGPDADVGDSRPTKRRKMALDDIVNN